MILLLEEEELDEEMLKELEEAEEDDEEVNTNCRWDNVTGEKIGLFSPVRGSKTSLLILGKFSVQLNNFDKIV